MNSVKPAHFVCGRRMTPPRLSPAKQPRDMTRADESPQSLMFREPGGSGSRIRAIIEPGNATIVRETRGDRREVSIALPPNIRFDSGAGLLGAWDTDAIPHLEFNNFQIGAMGIERVVIELAPNVAPSVPGNRVLLRKRYDGEQLRAIARLEIDSEGNVLELIQPMFGTNVIIRPTDSETAMRSYPAYRVINNAMVRPPYRISGAAMQGRIRYNFGFEEGIAFEIPETSDQTVRRESSGATIDICAGCGPGLSTDPSFLDNARQATAWMQIDHPRMQALVEPIAGRQISDTRKMELLMIRAQPYIEDIDFAGHFSALEILSRRSGDCTEAALLLAALGRATGIPTFVVSGLVYSRAAYHGTSNAFMPHSWTLAYVDGEWRSFDLALEEFDSTHIALTIGEGGRTFDQCFYPAGEPAGMVSVDRSPSTSRGIGLRGYSFEGSASYTTGISGRSRSALSSTGAVFSGSSTEPSTKIRGRSTIRVPVV